MDHLDISIEDPRWSQTSFNTLVHRAVIATLTFLDIPTKIAELGILACDDPQIAILNADFRSKAQPTNVLSWPSEERGAMSPGGATKAPQPGPDGLIELGDIAISYDTCVAEATAAAIPFEAHVTHLIVHGTLHLLGYDHENERDAALMEELEVKILGKMGVDDPYRMG